MTHTIEELVDEVAALGPDMWPNENMDDLFHGLTEEIGEPHRAFLKRKRKIRGTHAEWTKNFKEEFGQVLIQLICIANREGLDMTEAAYEAWAELLARPPERLDRRS